MAIHFFPSIPGWAPNGNMDKINLLHQENSTDRERLEAGRKWIARLMVDPDRVDLNVEVSHQQLSSRNDVPEVRFGLTDAQRKQVFRGYVWSMDRASFRK